MAIPYKLYGGSELEYISSGVTAVSRLWLREWIGQGIVTERFQVKVAALSESPLSCDNEFAYSYENDNHQVSLYAEAASLNALLGYILRVDGRSSPVGVSEVSRSLMDDCLIDYVNRILQENPDFDPGAATIHAMDSELVVKARPGDLVVRLQYEDASFEIVLSYPSIKSLCRHKAVENVPATRLVRPQECSIGGDIKLKVHVGGAELDYGVVSEVAVGDVIRLDSRIDEPLSVYTEDDQYVCRAYLGKQGNAKAAKIIVNK